MRGREGWKGGEVEVVGGEGRREGGSGRTYSYVRHHCIASVGITVQVMLYSISPSELSSSVLPHICLAITFQIMVDVHSEACYNSICRVSSYCKLLKGRKLVLSLFL